MAKYAYEEATAPVGARASSGGSWNQMLWFAVAAAGVGFAAYVFAVPYQRAMSAFRSRTAELGEVRAASQSAVGERDRLQARLEAGARDKEAADAKKRVGAASMGALLSGSLQERGVAVSVDGGRVVASFPADKIIDRDGIDVSHAGQTALKILAGAVKKDGGSVRVKALFSSAVPRRSLRALFRTAGEVSAVRAARVISVLNEAGIAPDRLMTFGEADKSPPHPAARGKKAPPLASAPDRVDIEIEPE